MTLDIRVEDLDRRLHKAASRKMLLVLNERQPGLQQLVVGLHVNHVVLVQLRGRQQVDVNKTVSTTSRITPHTLGLVSFLKGLVDTEDVTD